MVRALIVHGGAGTIASQRAPQAAAGCRAAALAGWRVLCAGGSALDAVQQAIATLEDDPSFNAGTGAVLTDDGRAQLDAGIMNGTTLDVGAVASVERIKNPIALARLILASPHVLLMGAGAEQFATEHGVVLCDPTALVTARQHAQWLRGYRAEAEDDAAIARDAAPGVGVPVSPAAPLAARAADGAAHWVARHGLAHSDGDKHGTVGAVAVDASGVIAAGASTGGIAAKHPGRVGDTPLAGCGFYAEDGLGGVSSTGHGEDFIRLVLAKRAVDMLAAGYSAQAAASAAIRMLGARVGGSGGLILLDAAGRIGYARNTPAMAHAFISDDMAEPCAGV